MLRHLSCLQPSLGWGAKSVSLWRTQKQSVDLVSAAVNRLGDSAKFSSQDLQDMASELQEVSNYGDEDILKKLTNNLLTFGNVSKRTPEEFKRIQVAALDLSATLGQDLQSSALQLGKALDDPIKGVTALGRAGVMFTDSQKKQIQALVDSGDALKAQGVILQEIEDKYGNAAKAAINPWTQMSNQFGDILETLGRVIEIVVLPIFRKVVDWVQLAGDWFNDLSPPVQKAIVVFGLLAAALGPVLVIIGALVSSIGAIAGALTVVLKPAILLVLPVLAGLTLAVVGVVKYHRELMGGC